VVLHEEFVFLGSELIFRIIGTINTVIEALKEDICVVFNKNMFSHCSMS